MYNNLSCLLYEFLKCIIIIMNPFTALLGKKPPIKIHNSIEYNSKYHNIFFIVIKFSLIMIYFKDEAKQENGRSKIAIFHWLLNKYLHYHSNKLVR